MTVLGIDPDDLASCVSCGLCLTQCPTFRVTGDEALSPRGRIATMRAITDGERPLDAEAVRVLDTCVQCRACETACPSGVPYGRMIEPARAVIEHRRGRLARAGRRALLAPLGHHRVLLAGSSVLGLAQRARLVPRVAGLPDRLPVRRPALTPGGSAAWLHVGCVMDAWSREVHVAVLRIAEALGVGVGLLDAGLGADCCGALHLHQGYPDPAHALLARTVAAAPPSGPIVTDVAGCGALLAEAGSHLGTPEAAAVAARVLDVHTWLDALVGADAVRQPLGRRVIVMDPCHLRHVQHAADPVHRLLARCGAEVVVADDEGLCCGAGGAYAAMEPDLAGRIRERKAAALVRAGAGDGHGDGGAVVVAAANAGCILHLRAAGLDVVHPISLVAEALGV